MFGLSTVKLLIYAAIVAAIFGAGVASGVVIMKPKVEAARADGHTAGVNETTSYYAGKLEQQTAQAKADYDQAVAQNNQLKADYANLQKQWKTDHDQAVATAAALTRRLAGVGADNQRLRNAFAAAAAGGGRCAGTGQAGAADPAVGPGVPAETGGVLPTVDGRLPLFDFVAGKLAEADAVLNVANECSAAMKAVP